MSSFGDNLNKSNVVDMKDYIETHKESLEETNKFIEQLKEETKDIDLDLDTPNTTDISNDQDIEKVSMNVLIDPETGEQKIIGRAGEDIKYNFEGIIKQINSGDPDILTTKPFTEQEIISYLQSTDDDTLVNELAGDINIYAKDLRDLLDIVNRKLNGEKFNVYKESPEEVKKLVDSYITESGGSIPVFNNKIP